MKFLIYIVFISIFFVNCSSDSGKPDLESYSIISDVLSLELTFGSDEEKLDSEFLLANPGKDICVNKESEIFISDENRIKVFDINGKEKRIIGGPGQGPGEFTSIGSPTIGPAGYLTVVNGSNLNIYGPDFKFTEIVRLNARPFISQLRNEKSWFLYGVVKAFTLSDSQRVWVVGGASGDPGMTDHQFHFQANINLEKIISPLVYESKDSYTVLAQYPGANVVKFGGRFYLNPYFGELLWEILPDNRIIYIHSEYDKKTSSGISSYILHVFSPDKPEQMQITHNFIPVKIPGEEKDKRFQKYVPQKAKESLIYYNPVQQLLSDDYYLFAFTFLQNQKGEYLVDIFDMEQNKYVKSVFFSNVPDAIKNGYAYRLKKGEDIFPEIEKYKIDPVIYRK